MSLDLVTINLSNVFDAGQAYVALSRARSLEGLELSGFDPSVIRADPTVKEFYQLIRSEASSYDAQAGEVVPDAPPPAPDMSAVPPQPGLEPFLSAGLVVGGDLDVLGARSPCADPGAGALSRSGSEFTGLGSKRCSGHLDDLSPGEKCRAK